MKSITKWLLSLYVAGAIITMGFHLSVPSLFGSRRMRTCLSQGRGLVNNLAGLLGDQVGLRARIGAPKTQRFIR